jgi:hypothetical protein
MQTGAVLHRDTCSCVTWSLRDPDRYRSNVMASAKAVSRPADRSVEVVGA